MDHSRTLEVCNRAIGWSGSIREASCRNCRGGEIAIKPIKAGRRAVSRGAAPRYELEVEARRIKEFPRLEFDGSNPAIVEAARLSIAAELRARAERVEVETPEVLS